MRIGERFVSFLVAVVTTGIWYAASSLVVFILLSGIARHDRSVFGMEMHTALHTMTLIVFSGGFVLALVRRYQGATSYASEAQTERVGILANLGNVGGCLTIVFFASYLPDFAIGSLLLAVGSGDGERDGP